MSTLTVSNISNGSVSTSSTNVIQGSAKAWVNYNANTQTVLNSFNVSSVTYGGTGNYTANFTTAMPNATYCPVFGAGWGGSPGGYIAVFDYYSARTSSSLNLLLVDVNGGSYNSPSVNIAVFSA